jgi:ubiquinone/menaquinone biosynthesis C-methylase UbiE
MSDRYGVEQDGALQQALDLSDLDATFLSSYARSLEISEWENTVRTRTRAIERAALKRWLLSFVGRSLVRTEDYVRQYYARWDKLTLADADPDADGSPRPMVWRGSKVFMTPWATNRITLLRLIRLIDFIKPRRVLEVGAGNGLYPLLLAGVFPDVEFLGAELTKEGVEIARRTQELEILPKNLEKFIPADLKDVRGFKRAVIEQGNARRLKYHDGSFDLVYTCLALEQMERIRAEALSEIARVSRRWVSIIEPIYDANESGVQRAYKYSMDYFQGKIGDLKSYGLQPVFVSDDFPQTFYMNVAHVVALRSPAT